jgi:DNA-binding response OmpR family regulator
MKIRRRSILIAENDRALSKVLRMHLERAGYTVLVAYDGEQAGILAARQRFDLIVAGFDSTEMNGFEFCRFVREDLGLAEVPIAVFSSRQADQESLFYRSGISKLFIKPIDPDVIVNFARETIGSMMATV